MILDRLLKVVLEEADGFLSSFLYITVYSVFTGAEMRF